MFNTRADQSKSRDGQLDRFSSGTLREEGDLDFKVIGEMQALWPAEETEYQSSDRRMVFCCLSVFILGDFKHSSPISFPSEHSVDEIYCEKTQKSRENAAKPPE